MKKTTQKHKTVLSWSGGKDSVITLQRLLKNEQYSVDHLLVSVNKSTDRVSMHGVRRELIEMQAKVLGIPVMFLELPENPSMELYNSVMKTDLTRLEEQGYTHCAFGDIFLEDLKSYRENQFRQTGLKPIFPIWKENTDDLAQSFIDDGFKALFVCVDKNKSISKYAGEFYSREFLESISNNIDPCGENGEFHTFVFDGPIFSEPIVYQKGKIVDKEYPSPGSEGKMVFRFCDLELS